METPGRVRAIGSAGPASGGASRPAGGTRPASAPAPAAGQPAANAPPGDEKPAATAKGPIATTGVAGLDAQLGGGVPRGTTLLIIAEPGNAIPLFSEQFSGGGMDIGDDIYYFQFDRPTNGLRKAVQSFVVKDRGAGLQLYDGYANQFGSTVGGLTDKDARSVTADQLVPTALEALANQMTGRPYRLVIESLSAITTPESEAQMVDFVRQLSYLGRAMGGIHLISIVKGMHSDDFETKLRHAATGVIEFGAERKGFGIYNYLIVSKLYGVRDPVRILLWKETDKGLWLESTKRVF